MFQFLRERRNERPKIVRWRRIVATALGNRARCSQREREHTKNKLNIYKLNQRLKTSIKYAAGNEIDDIFITIIFIYSQFSYKIQKNLRNSQKYIFINKKIPN